MILRVMRVIAHMYSKPRASGDDPSRLGTKTYADV